MIERKLKDVVKAALPRGKAILIMGARQVGKSTLLGQLFGDRTDVLWLNGDEPDTQQLFDGANSTFLKSVIGNNKYVVIDEAQRIRDVGLKMKLITDNIPDVQLVAAGSSSFELSSVINESLTGRKLEYRMYPLSFAEMVTETGLLEERRMLKHRMVYGYYPEVVTSPGAEQEVLLNLTNSYLYKDILSLDRIQKSEQLVRLLQSLALQVGSQVSYHELSLQVGLDSKTVERYIDVLEKCYIVFRLMSFSRNMRNELKKSRKIYFYDNGIRNAIIGNFTSLESRMPAEVGSLWENLMVSERVKKLEYDQMYGSRWFWRTKGNHEIDYIEERDGRIHTFEFKWNENKRSVFPELFKKNYPNSSFEVITPANYHEFIV